MIKDISKIREYLEGYVEVELPYEFSKGEPIQYITCEYDSEGNISCDSFFPNCKFIRRCNDIIMLESNTLIKRVPIYKRDKEGNIIYQSRFFIKEEVEEPLKECENDKSELLKTIEYQRSIIEKCGERIKTLEIDKHETYDKISTYEDLLQQGRYKLKELSIENRELKEKINHYEELIPKLYNSR
jgi:hypothetical protein